MYLTLQQIMGFAGRGAELEDRIARRTDILRPQPGFRGRALLNALGYPAKFAILTLWDSREDARSSARSEENRAFQAGNPSSAIFTTTRPVEAYETVIDVTSGGEARFVSLVEWNIANQPGNFAAFERERQEHYDLRQKHSPGFVFSRLARFLGTPTRYLTIIGYATYAGIRATNAAPEVQQYLQEHPLN